MTDWAAGIETRNYGIKSETDVRMLSELMHIILALAMVAGALLFYSWIRNQIINTGYESQSLFAVEESLLRIQNNLKIEEEVLCDPKRIDLIARNDLGMVKLHPSQLLPAIRDAKQNSAPEMAMANSEAANIKASGAAKQLADYSN